MQNHMLYRSTVFLGIHALSAYNSDHGDQIEHADVHDVLVYVNGTEVHVNKRHCVCVGCLIIGFPPSTNNNIMDE